MSIETPDDGPGGFGSLARDRRTGIVRFAACLAGLALLPAGIAPAPDSRMTLAEANRLSPAELAIRLLGAAGDARDYIEKSVWGNGGGIFASPGLNAVELYEVPRSSGFEGLCEVNAVHIDFERSDHRTAGDPPHRVTDFYKFRRFLMLAPTGERNADADWEALDRACARLSPVADRSAPRLLAVKSERPSEAYFAMRAVVKAQLLAPKLAGNIGCAPDPAEPGTPFCADPVASVAALPPREAHYFEASKCEDGLHWCVTGYWKRDGEGREGRVAKLRIVTDTTVTDPPSDFGVTGLALSAETWTE